MIIDDDPDLIASIGDYLSRSQPNVIVVGTASGGNEAIAKIGILKPQLLFIDVDLGDMTGFDVLSSTQAHVSTAAVFVSAYREHAFRAFEFYAIDYVGKPIDRQRMDQAVGRALKRLENNEPHPGLKAYLDASDDRWIGLPELHGTRQILLDDILHCEAERGYTNVHTRLEPSRIQVSRTLKDFERFLAFKGFVRIHKKHLVHAKYIGRYRQGNGGHVVLTDKHRTQLPVGGEFRTALMEALNKLI